MKFSGASSHHIRHTMIASLLSYSNWRTHSARPELAKFEFASLGIQRIQYHQRTALSVQSRCGDLSRRQR